jgi:hypothetical protein
LSVVERATDTDAVYQPPTQLPLLHEMLVPGGVSSILICVDCTASAFPALSKERYFTVVVVGTGNGPVYGVLACVGVDPLVV